MQTEPQTATQRAPHLWRAGQSGNKSGRTRTTDRLADLCAAFQAAHHRPPSPVELISLRSAAKLAAATESPRTSTEQAVRAGNTLVKALRLLGLAGPPAKPKLRRNIPSMSELLAREAPR
jgi:hypothetical protein